MKRSLTIILLAFTLKLSAGIDPYALRNQVFGTFEKKINVDTFTFMQQQLAVLGNSYVISMEEYHYGWHEAKRDSTHEKRVKYLEDMISMYQRAFEAMTMNFDTTTAFRLEYLKNKQSELTAYLNKGMTRAEAEALPEFKYRMRHYYCGMIIFEMMNAQVWTKANKDTQGQRDYFNNHPEKYQGQPFDISRTKVIYDYQKELEAELDEKVKSDFPSRINGVLSAKL